MFDKKGPKEVTLYIGQNTEIGGCCVGFMGNINASTCVFNCPGWSAQKLYVPINGSFYSGNTKIKIKKTDSESVTLGWEG